MRDRDLLDRVPRPGQRDRAPVGDAGDGDLGDALQRRLVVEAARQLGGRLRQQPLAQLGALDRGQVLDHVHDAVGLRAVAGDQRGLVEQPALLAGGDDDVAHEQRRRLGLAVQQPVAGQLGAVERAAVLVEDREARHDLAGRRLQQLLPRAGAQQRDCGVVDVDDHAVRRHHGDGLAERVQRAGQAPLDAGQPLRVGGLGLGADAQRGQDDGERRADGGDEHREDPAARPGVGRDRADQCAQQREDGDDRRLADVAEQRDAHRREHERGRQDGVAVRDEVGRDQQRGQRRAPGDPPRQTTRPWRMVFSVTTRGSTNCSR